MKSYKLIGNLVFLIYPYAIKNISDRELYKGLARSRILRERIRLEIRSSLKEILSKDFQLI